MWSRMGVRYLEVPVDRRMEQLLVHLSSLEARRFLTDIVFLCGFLIGELKARISLPRLTIESLVSPDLRTYLLVPFLEWIIWRKVLTQYIIDWVIQFQMRGTFFRNSSRQFRSKGKGLLSRWLFHDVTRTWYFRCPHSLLFIDFLSFILFLSHCVVL